ncbi:hypothetical protein PGB90_009032 [Kerria lacca]
MLQTFAALYFIYVGEIGIKNKIFQDFTNVMNKLGRMRMNITERIIRNSKYFQFPYMSL